MSAFVVSGFVRARIVWWAHVTETPDARRIAVLRRGTAKGLIGVMAVGGQVQPSWWVGDRLLWKNDQKKEKKKATSERMKRIMPTCKPAIT